MTILYTLKYWILWPWGCNALGPTGTSSHGAFVLYQHICSAAQSVTAGPADLEELTAALLLKVVQLQQQRELSWSVMTQIAAPGRRPEPYSAATLFI